MMLILVTCDIRAKPLKMRKDEQTGLYEVDFVVSSFLASRLVHFWAWHTYLRFISFNLFVRHVNTYKMYRYCHIKLISITTFAWTDWENRKQVRIDARAGIQCWYPRYGILYHEKIYTRAFPWTLVLRSR